MFTPNVPKKCFTFPNRVVYFVPACTNLRYAPYGERQKVFFRVLRYYYP